MGTASRNLQAADLLSMPTASSPLITIVGAPGLGDDLTGCRGNLIRLF